jgi:hypothetical protein
MKAKKVVWNSILDDPNSEKLAITVDGVDCMTREMQDPYFNLDPKNSSHKFNGCGRKYLLALSVQRPELVWMSGGMKPSRHDTVSVREDGLKDLLAKGKFMIVDRGFNSKYEDEKLFYATPSELDSPELENYKTRCRMRQESFNRRLKCFQVLKSEFRHGADKHEIAFQAVAVTVVYQMENGSPIFSV